MERQYVSLNSNILKQHYHKILEYTGMYIYQIVKCQKEVKQKFLPVHAVIVKIK